MSPVAHVLGVDPGKSTGIAVLTLEFTPGKKPQSYAMLRDFHVHVAVLATARLDNLTSALRFYVDGIPRDAPLVVSCERYVVTRMSLQTQDTQSLEATGRLNAVLELLEIPHTFVQYTPSQAKPHWPDARLRALGVDLRGTTDHARDALRHGLEWCVRYVRNAESLPSNGSSID